MRKAIVFVVVMGIGTLAGRTIAGESATPATGEGLLLKQSQPWSPEAVATPVTRQAADGAVTIEGNGTHTCCGGWQFYYTGIRSGQAYRIRTHVEQQGLGNVRDSLVALVLYDQWQPKQAETGQRPCNYLLPKPAAGGGMRFEAVVVPPEGATSMTVRYIFRWSGRGTSRWSVPQIGPTAMPEKKPIKICVVSTRRMPPTRTKVQPLSRGLDLPADVAQSVDTWGSLILTACQRKPNLIVTPEVVIGGKKLVEGSVAVPGPAIKPFETIAHQYHVYLVLGTRERAGDAFYNSAVLVGPAGKVVGVYRKVHLATSEGFSGLSAGTSFPVFDTSIGRIGCLICMDTTVCESARMLGLKIAKPFPSDRETKSPIPSSTAS